MKCPSCGREIPDDVDMCPYCTASLKHRVRIKTIYIIALSLIIIGSTYAVLAYTGGEVPITKIKDLGLTDNYNFIRLHGVVDSYPWVYENDYEVTSFRFKLNDGTGTITIKLYSTVIKKMLEYNKIPEMGDIVDIKGTYLYSSNSLVLNNIDYLTIEKREGTEMKVERIVNAPPWELKNGERVYVDGNITSVREYSFGFICSIDEKLDLLIPRAYYSLNVLNISSLGSGYARIYGSLEFYRPIEPSSSYEVVNLPEIMDNPEKYNGSSIRIPWAQVVEKNEEAKTIRVYSNGSYVDVYVRGGVRYYYEGDYVEIQGKFINYRGVWEISVSRSNDFVSEPKWEIIAGTSYEILQKKNYERNENLEEFSLREIEGVVVDYRIYTYSAIITVWSENKSYSVYLESNKMFKGIDYGKRVIVRGVVTIYNGEPEIKVRPFTQDVVEVVG